LVVVALHHNECGTKKRKVSSPANWKGAGGPGLNRWAMLTKGRLIPKNNTGKGGSPREMVWRRRVFRKTLKDRSRGERGKVIGDAGEGKRWGNGKTGAPGDFSRHVLKAKTREESNNRPGDAKKE